VLLSKVFSHWYTDQMDKIEHNKLEQEQKRKDKFRQELTDLYKDL